MSVALASWLEKLGGRVIYLCVTKFFREKPLPPVKARQAELSPTDLEKCKMDARYFGLANLGRFGFCLPIVLVLYLLQGGWIFWLLVVQSVLHLTLAWSELYKYNLASSLVANENVPDQAISFPELNSKWFEPQSWETQNFYKVIGVERAKWVVLGLYEVIQTTREQRARGETYQFMDSKQPEKLIEFEANTRVSELVHYFVGFLDAIPFVFAILGHHWAFALATGYLLVCDLYLSLLQRYHRVRIWKIVQKLKKRMKKSGAVHA